MLFLLIENVARRVMEWAQWQQAAHHTRPIICSVRDAWSYTTGRRIR